MKGGSNCSQNVHLTETGIWVRGRNGWPKGDAQVAVEVIDDRVNELLVLKSLEEAE